MDNDKLQEKIDTLTELSKLYILRNNILIEYDKEITIEGQKMRTTVLNGRFSTGMTVFTQTMNSWVNEDPENKKLVEYRRKYLEFCLLRHVAADWGKQCLEDFLTNEQSLRDGERLMSVYNSPEDDRTIWIITEWDRSYTTILGPIDY